MSEFTTTISELKAKAEQLQNLNEQFQTERAQLEETAASLSGMWEGEAKTMFDTAFKSDMVQLQNFYNAIIAYINALSAIAQTYMTTEAKNVEIARTRSYH